MEPLEVKEMAESLPHTTYAPSAEWNVGTLRDFILGLIEANDRRYATEILGIQRTITDLTERFTQLDVARQLATEVAFTAQQTGLNAALLAQKEAVSTALVSAEKSVSAALSSSAQAVQKAEMASEKRFESVNEFRQTLSDQQRTLMPRAEVEVLVRGMNDKIDLLTKSYSSHESSRQGMASGWTMAVGVIGLIALLIGIVSFFMHGTAPLK